MRIDLSGQWKIWLEAEDGLQSGTIQLPGILQARGYGNPITTATSWISNLYDAFWFEQEEYKQAQKDECLIPFLAQPPRHFLGKAYYEREFEIKRELEFKKRLGTEISQNEEKQECSGEKYAVEMTEEEWFLRIELTHWRSHVWIDDIYMGEDCSLCTAHEIPCGKLSAGKHVIKVCIDNSMQYPYRPDGHGVSDALAATWNGMVGEISLETGAERSARELAHREYAKQHPRKVEIKVNKIPHMTNKAENGIAIGIDNSKEEHLRQFPAFYIDGVPEYFRGTHFGGDYPLTGCPATERSWWLEKMQIIKDWGLNAIRFHSYCPPEAAFAAADEAGLYLLVECGMWNHFEEGIEMLEILRKESRRILQQFGHHPSFAFFSPSNEPGGNWYQVLRKWVEETKAYDRELGYEGRRAYTAQSGWFYDVEPAEITGTDFVYFHRSAYGPYHGGTIRNPLGWRGRDYSPSLKGVKQPVICHELGQWCAYPDFRVIDKFSSYLKPGNYMVFKEMAGKRGLLSINEQLAKCSGRNQLRLYKEELEANFRTPEITGFELLDLHDYLGQGTALVGLLDPFWESKGYAGPEEFRAFCGETVLLARCASYVWKNTQTAEIPVEICHFGKADLQDVTVEWKLVEAPEEQGVGRKGEIKASLVKCGENTSLGVLKLDFSHIEKNSHLVLSLSMGERENHWDLYVYVKEPYKTWAEESVKPDISQSSDTVGAEQKLSYSTDKSIKCLYTRNWIEVKEALKQGGNVVYSPWLSDLDLDCPCLSIKNVYWNSQMGPTWGRSLGLVVQKEHPIFATFPTEESGGWQWEDILENARGLDLRGMEGVEPIVRPIDDWNRSLPLGLMLEAKVEKGKLLLISADLEGSFEARPEAYSLKQAILQYVASDSFAPEYELKTEQIEQKLFPVLRTRELIESVHFDETALVRNGEAFLEPSPNSSLRIEKADFPVTIGITLKKAVNAQGWIYLPEQGDRAHAGFLKDYRLEYLSEEGCWKLGAEGAFQNTSLSQRVLFSESIPAKEWRLVVTSCYGCVDKEVWRECREGWRKVFQPKTAILQIAGLHLICEEEAEHSDRIFWERCQRSATKEIEN